MLPTSSRFSLFLFQDEGSLHPKSTLPHYKFVFFAFIAFIFRFYGRSCFCETAAELCVETNEEMSKISDVFAKTSEIFEHYCGQKLSGMKAMKAKNIIL